MGDVIFYHNIATLTLEAPERLGLGLMVVVTCGTITRDDYPGRLPSSPTVGCPMWKGVVEILEVFQQPHASLARLTTDH